MPAHLLEQHWELEVQLEPLARQSQSGSAPGAHWALQVPPAEQSGPGVQVKNQQGKNTRAVRPYKAPRIKKPKEPRKLKKR